MKDTRDVTTTLSYFELPIDGSAPSPLYKGKPESYHRSTYEQVEVTIKDISKSLDMYRLDDCGFQIYYQNLFDRKDVLTEEAIQKIYYPKMTEFLRDMYVSKHKPFPSKLLDFEEQKS